MPRALNLTSSQAAAVRSALTALDFEKGALHIDFDPVDVFVTETGWIAVRGGRHGYEEHKDLVAFKAAYGLHDAEPDLLALAHEIESICETYLQHAVDEGDDTALGIWGERRDRCRAAIAASLARSATTMT
jgi:hypothetical protein